jgi:quercetin 2,3-dioxygenase
MFTVRKATERGRTQLDWLDSFHSFSFGDYHDAKHHHFRSLRVINDDLVAEGAGFGMHPHRDMEIITYMISGELAHQDSLGSGGIIRPGDVQYMSAGTGILHSEFNPSKTTPAKLLQIWLMPDRKDHTPRYEQKSFPASGDSWDVLVSPDSQDGSLGIRQDAVLLRAKWMRPGSLTHTFAPGRAGWLQVVAGDVTVADNALSAGDALMIEDEAEVSFSGVTGAEVLLFDLG